MAMALAEDFDPVLPVVEAVQAGDRNAFDELLRRQGRWVRGIVLGVLGHQDAIDDVSQQVWSTVWQQIAELRDPSLWRPWLYRIARNAALDAGRDVSRRRNQVRTLVDHRPLPSSTEAATDELVSNERNRTVLDAIQALPVLYREPFVLRHVNGWSYKQIADVMDMPVDSIETRLVRARRMLRESLKDKLGWNRR